MIKHDIRIHKYQKSNQNTVSVKHAQHYAYTLTLNHRIRREKIPMGKSMINLVHDINHKDRDSYQVRFIKRNHISIDYEGLRMEFRCIQNIISNIIFKVGDMQSSTFLMLRLYLIISQFICISTRCILFCFFLKSRDMFINGFYFCWFNFCSMNFVIQRSIISQFQCWLFFFFIVRSTFTLKQGFQKTFMGSNLVERKFASSGYWAQLSVFSSIVPKLSALVVITIRFRQNFAKVR